MDLMEHDPKPVFLHLKWYKAIDHVGTNLDSEIGYRAKLSDQELKDADPVHKYEEYLLSSGIQASKMQKVRDEVSSRIGHSVEKAKAAPYPTESDLYRGVFA